MHSNVFHQHPVARGWRLLLAACLLLSLVGMTTPQQTHAQATNERCFAETGFCISGRIRDYWQQNGGLAVFGFPITPQQEEMVEGTARQVQWFERNRLELHPENEPPYDVLVGRIGEEYFDQKGINWEAVYLPVDPQDDCRYFSETGHNVCGDILQAWQAQGLELDGQAGASQEESLALWGLPLSEAHEEPLGDGNTYTVQWFERARLELHPENEPPYHVLPGLLGLQVWQMQNDTATPHSTEEEPSMHSPFVRANTRFAFTFFNTLQEQTGQQNMFISPISLAYALAMTYNGAVGDTQQAMAQVLNIQDMDLDEVNQSFADLMQTLETADPEVQLAIANSLWAREDVAFEEDFLQRNRQFYAAEVERLDFNDPSAVETINAWVKEQTNDKIPSIVNDLDPLTIMVLINAIYFKGTWSEEFDPEKTSDRAFNLPDGSTKQVPMMEQDKKFPYYEGEGFQAISLPYGEERLHMSIFLPEEKSSLAAFYQQLNAQNWATWMQKLRKREGVIGLPRFKLEDEHDLQQTLSDMGMGVAFACGQADFSRLYAEEDVCITKVKQKTFIEVNEEGTEAAAATSVEVGLTSALPEEPFSMIVDRPFFFAIHDTQTGAILFMGSIVEPKDYD